MKHRWVPLAVALLVAARTALGQPAQETPKPAPAAAAPDDDAKRKQAVEHFEKGIALFEEEAWSAALAEFLASRELYATRANTKNSAACLRKLHRFDEALDMFEALLREFPNLPADDRTMADRAVKDLQGLVGGVEVRGAEAGAAIVVDGRDRGRTPAPGPLRVSAGTHVVRVYKEGFAPFESRVDVAGGQTTALEARLGALTRAGRLKVTEQTGKSIDVVVDNVVVGKSPWEGPLAVGEHTVALRGEGNVGTQPAAAPVALNQLTPLTLVAETLDASMRVEPTPRGARVAIDGVAVGRGIWEGRLRSGGHRVEVAADGFLPIARQVTLERGERKVNLFDLVRDPDSAVWKAAHPSRLVVDVEGALLIAPSLGGDVAGACSDPCERSLGLGALAMVRGGYRLGNGLGFELGAGYLSVAQSTSNRPARLLPRGLAPNPGVADDALSLRGLLAGLSASLHVGDRFPFLVRLGGGALLGSLRNERSGSFTTVSRSVSAGNGMTTTLAATPYETGPLVESRGATYIYVAPDVELGVRLGDHFEIGAGVGAMFLFAIAQPKWADDRLVATGNDGVAGFGEQALAGRTIVIVTPALGARYDF